jgi:hypothetical protein
MRLQVPRVRDDQLPVNADDDDNCSTDNHGTTIAPHDFSMMGSVTYTTRKANVHCKSPSAKNPAPFHFPVHSITSLRYQLKPPISPQVLSNSLQYHPCGPSGTLLPHPPHQTISHRNQYISTGKKINSTDILH